MQDLTFVTGNKHKLTEAQAILRAFGINIKHLDYDCPEIQSSDLSEIALECARSSFEHLKIPLCVEDSGLFISGLKGFPGPYSSYVFKTIGNGGILRLLDRVRKAKFVSAVAYKDLEKEKTFIGEVEGNIALKEQGRGGFGFDPIFIPKGKDKTFAQDRETKNEVSHRKKAFVKFARWFSGKEAKI